MFPLMAHTLGPNQGAKFQHLAGKVNQVVLLWD